MFDLSFGEMLVVALVVLVVVGPRELPRMLRTLGQGIARLRNVSRDLRANSGIDDILRDEGLDEDLRALRSLSRGRVVDAIVNEAAAGRPNRPRPPSQPRDAAKAEQREAFAATAESPDESPAAGAPTGPNTIDATVHAPPASAHVERERLGSPQPTEASPPQEPPPTPPSSNGEPDR